MEVGDGYGYGSGYGSGSGDEYLVFPWVAKQVLQWPNAEQRRVLIQRMGPDRFFGELTAAVVHEDTDGAGNRRRLLRVSVKDTEAGYLQAVEVVCPTTGRVYHLGVEPGVSTCQDAVASTFGLRAEEYAPARET